MNVLPNSEQDDVQHDQNFLFLITAAVESKARSQCDVYASRHLHEIRFNDEYCMVLGNFISLLLEEL